MPDLKSRARSGISANNNKNVRITSTNSGSRISWTVIGFPRTGSLQFHADGRLAILIKQRAAPDLGVGQSLAHGVGGAAMMQIGGDERAADAQKPPQRLVQRRRRRVAVEKGD